LRAEQIKEDLYHRRPFAGVGIARFGQNGPDNRNPDAAINDREHQDVEINGSNFPICPIQRQGVRPRDVKQLHDKQREFGIGHLKFAQKALKPFVVRCLFGMARKGGGQNRKIDRPHGIESQEKSSYKFDAGFVPRLCQSTLAQAGECRSSCDLLSVLVDRKFNHTVALSAMTTIQHHHFGPIETPFVQSALCHRADFGSFFVL
jgi:hypothetical protein